jgi:hypothetical protein
MGTALFLALAACALARPPVEVQRNPVAIEQVPAAARATLVKQSKGRALYHVVQVAKSDGCVSYEASYKNPLRFSHKVAVASNGDLIGNWANMPNGDGP